MTGNTERLVAELPSELKHRVDADPRDNKQVVIAALQTEFATEEEAAVQRRIEEKEERIATLKGERNEREREIEQNMEELESLQRRLDSIDANEEAKQDSIDNRLEELERVQMVIDESHPSVQGLAREHFNGDAEAALEAMQERNDELDLVPWRYL